MDNEMAAAPAPEAAPAAGALAGAVPVGFWVRGGALFIDAAVTMFVGAVLGVVLFFLKVPQWLAFIVQYAVSLAYHTAFVAEWGATVGKMAAGIEIVRPDGSHLSYPRALGRFLAQYVSLFVLGLGYVMAAFTPEKRALHDYIADSRVIYKPGVGEGRKIAMVAIAAMIPVGGFLLGLAIAMSIGTRGLGKSGGASPFGRFSDLVAKSQEGADKGNLGAMRAGLSIYYGDKNGAYPADLNELVPKYVQQIPVLKLSGRADTSDVEYYDDDVCGGPKGDQLDSSKLRNSGKWGYVRPRPGAAQGKPCVGNLFVDSSAADTTGKVWNSY